MASASVSFANYVHNAANSAGSAPRIPRNALRAARRTRGAALAAVQEPQSATKLAPTLKVDEEVIADGVTMVRCVTEERLKFEVEYGMKRGTTDNSYFIKGDDKTALFDIPSREFAEAFAAAEDTANLNSLVLGHLSPKRIDTLAIILAARPADAPPLEICCSNPAAQIINTALEPGTPASSQALTDAWEGPDGQPRATIRVVRTGDELSMGGDRSLRFIATPTPRWPDLVVTYDTEARLLFTSKLFSAHVAVSAADDVGGLEEFEEDWRYFFDCMLAPCARQAAAALAKLDIRPTGAGLASAAADATAVSPVSVAPKASRVLRALASNQLHALRDGSDTADAEPVAAVIPNDVLLCDALAPAHGPLVRAALAELTREYAMWTETQIEKGEDVSVAVIYASAYGNTSAMAQAMARGITKAGVGVEMLNCELATTEEVEALMDRNEGFCLGSPTLGGHMPTPVQTALGTIVKEGDRDKPCGVFGSFGWSGEAVDLMEGRLKDGGFKFAHDAIRCKFKPTEATLQQCEESGTDLAQKVKELRKRKELAERRASGVAPAGTSDAAAAVGRIVGSLCAVTARQGDAQSAMLASWVSQASFNPPCLTVAVAKERAVESFLLKGSAFNLNVLPAGGERDIMKALLKPFKPGENRFGDLEVDLSEETGCAIVKDALSCVECRVQSRMEAGDHWIVLAEVTGGQLLKEQALTAIHHRKSGTSY